MSEERPYSIESVKFIKYYNQDFVKNRIVGLSKGKEAVGSYGGKGYAKRPDVLENPQDVVELVKKGVTSFHISEETWSNALLLETGAKKKDQDKLRVGWDLLLDIDCPEFEFSKIAAELVIELLKNYVDRKSITCKFSGNHGFHIAVPFEAFPEYIGDGKLVRELFPEAPQKIAKFITEKIEPFMKEEFEKQYGLNFLEVISEKIKKPISEFHTDKNELLVEEILEIDTILISSRHLFRAVFSINEKTFTHPDGCKVSVPVDIDHVRSFDRSNAVIENVLKNRDSFANIPFMDRNVEKDSARNLFIESYDHTAAIDMYKQEITEKKDAETKKFNSQVEFEDEDKYPIESFPPCVLLGLNGLKDGRKRFLFVLRNFLNSANWTKDEIKLKFEEWNSKNFEPLRPSEIDIHVRYISKKVLPPNCDRKEYYDNLGICKPDGLCARIKNPISYAKKKSFLLEKEKEMQEKLKKREESARKKEEKEKAKAEKMKAKAAEAAKKSDS